MSGFGSFSAQRATGSASDNHPASAFGSPLPPSFAGRSGLTFGFGNSGAPPAKQETEQDQLSQMKDYFLQIRASVDNLATQVAKQNEQNQFAELKQQAVQTEADIKELGKQISRENASMRQTIKDTLAKTAAEIKKMNDDKWQTFLEDWKKEAAGWSAIIIGVGRASKCEVGDKGNDVAPQRLLQHISSTVGNINGTLLHHVEAMEKLLGSSVNGNNGRKGSIIDRIESLVEKHRLLNVSMSVQIDRLERSEAAAGDEEGVVVDEVGQ